MFRVWVSRSSSIPIREQLSAQLLFGILSHRLRPGERLPSVRDFARRIKIHPNTVSAAYRDLVDRGWLQRRAGSGVFVREHRHDGPASVQSWIDEGIQRGFSIEQMRAALDGSGQPQPRRVLVIHPDSEFAKILAAELEEICGCAVESGTIAEANEPVFVLTTASSLALMPQVTPDRREVIPLKSIEEVIARVPRPKSPAMMAIVSRSESIRKWASVLTPALGLIGTDLIQRNPSERGWKNGLGVCDLIAADVLAAREVPKKAVVLRLIAESFLPRAREVVTGEKA